MNFKSYNIKFEYFERILFSLIVLKYIFAMLKIRDYGMIVCQSVKERAISPFCEGFIYTELRNCNCKASREKNSQKLPNLQ